MQQAQPAQQPYNREQIAALALGGTEADRTYVRGKLIALYDACEEKRGMLRNDNYRLHTQYQKICLEQQQKIIEKYTAACANWAESNGNGEDVWNARLQNNALQNAVNALDVQQQELQQVQGQGIRVGHINVQSLLHIDKFQNLQIILNALGFHVFVVSETWVKGVDDQFLEIEGYSMQRLDRDYVHNDDEVSKIQFNCGGLLVYVRNDMQFEVLEKTNSVVRNEAQSCVSLLQYIHLRVWVQGNQNSAANIFAVYNPPWGGHIHAMDNILYHISTANLQNVIILGDINIDILGGNNQEYRIRFVQMGFQQHIEKVTRPASNTLIDHIYTRQQDNGLVNGKGVAALEGFADHNLIYCRTNRPLQ